MTDTKVSGARLSGQFASMQRIDQEKSISEFNARMRNAVVQGRAEYEGNFEEQWAERVRQQMHVEAALNGRYLIETPFPNKEPAMPQETYIVRLLIEAFERRTAEIVSEWEQHGFDESLAKQREARKAWAVQLNKELAAVKAAKNQDYVSDGEAVADVTKYLNKHVNELSRWKGIMEHRERMLAHLRTLDPHSYVDATTYREWI